MMVLVKRRADGLYNTHKNPGWHGKQGWSDDPSECTPFRSEQGARAAFRSHVPYVTCDCPRSKGRQPWIKNCEHEKARKAEIRRMFDERYEIVAVRMVI